MQFVIDENIPKELTTWLKEKGHQFSCVRKGSPDEEVAEITRQTNFILLTQNRHFSNTLNFPPKNFPGIVRIKIHPSYVEDIGFALDKLFTVFSQQKDFRGKLIILEKYGFFKLKE